ncbi:MAG: flagellar type III secretion system pore protein FliP [Candidatus Eremiobacteraeota bacterium]|nr:flagellar type III secretion system pore protein FliP [Candidatus Eremiobacteraeota bacterium]
MNKKPNGFGKLKIVLIVVSILLVGILSFVLVRPCFAQNSAPTIKLPDIKLGTKDVEEGEELSVLLQIIFALTILSLAPYILIMATSFIRVTIVLSFVRTALGTQQVPPTQVLMGLALFITFYIMMPVGEEIHKNALVPLMKKKIKMNEFSKRATIPIRNFLLRQTRDKDLKLFVKLARKSPNQYKNRKEVPLYVLLPAYIISEIKTAFQIGFVIYLPFLVIDMVVASVLMSMGMFMLSPMQISMPFKLLLFVMIDGWGLIVENLVKSFSPP